MTTQTTTPPPPALQKQFQAFATEWKVGASLLSSTTSMIAHPAYQAISLGSEVVPLILRDLETAPAYWFEALRALTQENPVPPEACGQFQVMADAWLAWGRSRGLI